MNTTNKFITQLIGVLFFSLLLNSTVILAKNSANKQEESKSRPPAPNITVKRSEVFVKVDGMVCSFCAKGIQKKLSKLKFVDTKLYKQGSKGSIKQQKIIIAIKKHAKPNIKTIYNAIRSGGYTPKAAYMLNPNSKLIKFNAKGQLCASLSC